MQFRLHLNFAFKLVDFLDFCKEIRRCTVIGVTLLTIVSSLLAYVAYLLKEYVTL